MAPDVRHGLVKDGGFETPVVAPPGADHQTFTDGQNLGPWLVSTPVGQTPGSGEVDLTNNLDFQPYEGKQSLDLNGLAPGAVSQTFETTRNTAYTVTYALAGNVDGPPAIKTGDVRIDGQLFQKFSFDTTGKTKTNMGWVKHALTFVATGPSTTLTFESTTPADFGPVIDDVNVTRSPREEH